MRAASSCSRSSDCSEVMKIRQANGSHCHATMTMIDAEHFEFVAPREAEASAKFYRVHVLPPPPGAAQVRPVRLPPPVKARAA